MGTDTVGPLRLLTCPLPFAAAFLRSFPDAARAMASSMAMSCTPFTRTVSRPSAASFSLPPLSAASVRSTASRLSASPPGGLTLPMRLAIPLT